jgi:hypothetical protein
MLKNRTYNLLFFNNFKTYVLEMAKQYQQICKKIWIFFTHYIIAIL